MIKRIYDLLNGGTKTKKYPKYFEFLYGLHQTQTITPLHYGIWGILENKTSATSHPIRYCLEEGPQGRNITLPAQTLVSASQYFIRISRSAYGLFSCGGVDQNMHTQIDIFIYKYIYFLYTQSNIYTHTLTCIYVYIFMRVKIDR